MNHPRYSVVVNHEFRSLKVYDNDCCIYVDPQDWIGCAQFDALIEEARTRHPKLRSYRVSLANRP